VRATHEHHQLTPPVLRAACHAQSFIHRAGPQVLLADLPPKTELVLSLAPSATQTHLLSALLGLIDEFGRNTLRDTEVWRWAGPDDTGRALAV
jgi:hypothetical protein